MYVFERQSENRVHMHERQQTTDKICKTKEHQTHTHIPANQHRHFPVIGTDGCSRF